MPFNQLAAPCWVLDPEGGPGGEDLGHSVTEAEALKDLKDHYPPEDYAPGTVTVVVQPAPCWTITCDGECGDRPEDDEYGWNIHCATRKEAEVFAESCGWIITKDGRVFCEDDTPAGQSLEDGGLAVVEQIPGQLTLLGEGDQ
jgi:hypothetical protein